jgi:hypothetical protein
MDRQQQTLELLHKVGAIQTRASKGRVMWKLPRHGNRLFVTTEPGKRSDPRAWLNNYSNLRKIVGELDESPKSDSSVTVPKPASPPRQNCNQPRTEPLPTASMPVADDFKKKLVIAVGVQNIEAYTPVRSAFTPKMFTVEEQPEVIAPLKSAAPPLWRTKIVSSLPNPSPATFESITDQWSSKHVAWTEAEIAFGDMVWLACGAEDFRKYVAIRKIAIQNKEAPLSAELIKQQESYLLTVEQRIKEIDLLIEAAKKAEEEKMTLVPHRDSTVKFIAELKEMAPSIAANHKHRLTPSESVKVKPAKNVKQMPSRSAAAERKSRALHILSRAVNGMTAAEMYDALVGEFPDSTKGAIYQMLYAMARNEGSHVTMSQTGDRTAFYYQADVTAGAARA